MLNLSLFIWYGRSFDKRSIYTKIMIIGCWVAKEAH